MNRRMLLALIGMLSIMVIGWTVIYLNRIHIAGVFTDTAYLMLSQKRYDEAKKYYRISLLFHRQPEVLRTLGELEYFTGDKYMTWVYYNLAATMEEDGCSRYFDWIDRLDKTGRFADMLSVAGNAYSCRTNRDQYKYLRDIMTAKGVAYLRLKQYDQAIQAFSEGRILEIQHDIPPNPGLYCGLTQAYENENDNISADLYRQLCQ